MLSYDSMKQIITNDFLSYLPRKYRNGSVKIFMGGENLETEMFSVVTSNLPIAPSISLNDTYYNYLSVGDLNETLEETAATLVYALEQRETEQLECVSISS